MFRVVVICGISEKASFIEIGYSHNLRFLKHLTHQSLALDLVGRIHPHRLKVIEEAFGNLKNFNKFIRLAFYKLVHKIYLLARLSLHLSNPIYSSNCTLLLKDLKHKFEVC